MQVMRASFLGNPRVDLEKTCQKVQESILCIELGHVRIELSIRETVNTKRRRKMQFTFNKRFTAAYMMLLMVARESGYGPHSKECLDRTIYSLSTFYGASQEEATEWATSAQLRMRLTQSDDIAWAIAKQIKAVFNDEPCVLDEVEEKLE